MYLTKKTKICHIMAPSFYLIISILYSKLSSQVTNQLTCFYRLAKTMQEPKFHVSNSKNEDMLYNGTFILPDLINMATSFGGVRSDLTAPFKPPCCKKLNWRFQINSNGYPSGISFGQNTISSLRWSLCFSSKRWSLYFQIAKII